MKNIIIRLCYLIVGWLCIFIAYNGTPYFQRKPFVLTSSFIDNLIPFTPHAVWLYCSFFILIPLSFFYATFSKVRWMSACFIAISILAGACYLIFPTTMIFPIDTGTSISSWFLAQMINIDITQNCCPSLHVALTIIVVWGSLNAHRPIRNCLLILWGCGICFSIIQLRRHVFIDFIGGTILALFVGYSMKFLFHYSSKKHNSTKQEPLS